MGPGEAAIFSGTYDLPFGFQTSGILTYRTGLPFSAFTGTDSNRDSQRTDKPIINGVRLLRNSFRQPNFFNIDMRVTKFFNINERHKLALMFDMFNFTNTHNFFYNVSTNESTTSAAGSLWGTKQAPNAAFRTIHLPSGSPPDKTCNPGVDPTLNCGGARVASPFQLQVALRYNF